MPKTKTKTKMRKVKPNITKTKFDFAYLNKKYGLTKKQAARRRVPK